MATSFVLRCLCESGCEGMSIESQTLRCIGTEPVTASLSYASISVHRSPGTTRPQKRLLLDPVSCPQEAPPIGFRTRACPRYTPHITSPPVLVSSAKRKTVCELRVVLMRIEHDHSPRYARRRFHDCGIGFVHLTGNNGGDECPSCRHERATRIGSAASTANERESLLWADLPSEEAWGPS